MNILKNVKQLLRKRSELQAEIARIDAILAPLGDVGPGVAAKTIKGRKRKTMSAAARAKISAAAKARWKKVKAAGKTRL